MKCSFHVGQRVVCVYEGPWFNVLTGLPAECAVPLKDAVYEVAAIVLNCLGEPALTLKELLDTGNSFNASVFEPVIDLSVFTAMLDKAPAPKELEPA